MRYFSKAGNVKTKITRVKADLTRGLSLPHEQGKNCPRDLINFSTDQYPWLASRKPFREMYYAKNCKDGVGAYNSIIYYAKSGEFFYNGEKKFDVSVGKKKFCDYNDKILIFPDMMYYNPNTNEYGRFGITTDEITYKISHRTVGVVDFGLAAIESDDIKLTDYFKVGDGIKITDEEGLGISGFHTITAVNKDFGVLFFDRFEFGDGDGFTLKGKISNGAPEKCDAACVCGGRVWVAGGNKIQATTINDECNWAVGGDDEKSSFICDFDSGETITACVEFEGSPVFFSEKKIYKIYGDRASNFHLKCCSNWGGIPKRMKNTVAVVKDKIFYISKHGVTCFDGSAPKVLTRISSLNIGDAYAASYGDKYYVFVDNGDLILYVYDDTSAQWQRYGNYDIRHFLSYSGGLYAYAPQTIYSISGETELLKLYTTEFPPEILAEFLFDTSGGRPINVGLYIESSEETDCNIYVSYESIDDREQKKAVSGIFDGLIEIPLVPRNCDKVSIHIEGMGEITIKELYVDLID